MNVITLPQARTPLGQVNVPGQDKPLPVTIDIEWMRALSSLVDRVGGVTGEEAGPDAASTLISTAAFLPHPAPLPPPREDAQSIAAMVAFLPRHTTPAPNPDDAQSIAAMKAFLPHQATMTPNPADSQFVLGNQIFGS